MADKQGAGIIPFARHGNSTYYLFHKTFKGRRAGLFVDFGGGSRVGESFEETAIREFIEETEAMFFAQDIHNSYAEVNRQKKLIATLIENTQQAHPDWWLKRLNSKNNTLRNWKTFFIQVDYKKLNAMNKAWKNDRQYRFVKRRELFWLSSQELLELIDNTPEKLWQRVRQLQNLRELVLEINASK